MNFFRGKELSKFIAADKISVYLYGAKLFAGSHLHQVGQTLIDSRVTEATADTMTVRACMDRRAVEMVNASGAVVTGPAGAPVLEIAMVKLDPSTGHWIVSELIHPDPVQRC